MTKRFCGFEILIHENVNVIFSLLFHVIYIMVEMMITRNIYF